MIKFVSDLQKIGGYSWHSTEKGDDHNITEILLEVTLNTNIQDPFAYSFLSQYHVLPITFYHKTIFCLFQNSVAYHYIVTCLLKYCVLLITI